MVDVAGRVHEGGALRGLLSTGRRCRVEAKRGQPAMGRHGLIRSLLWKIRCIALVLSASVIVICCWPLPDRAESPKSIGLELNKLEQQGGNCRAYLVIANPGTDAFTGFTLDLIVFDHSGRSRDASRSNWRRCVRRKTWSRCSIFRKPRAAASAIYSLTTCCTAAARMASSAAASTGSRLRQSCRSIYRDSWRDGCCLIGQRRHDRKRARYGFR
jgi:hypothetical protein